MNANLDNNITTDAEEVLAGLKISNPDKFKYIELVTFKEDKQRKLTLRCTKHDEEFKVYYNSAFRMGRFLCPKCKIKTKRAKDTQEILNRIKSEDYEKFKYIEIVNDFAEDRSKMVLRCTEHDETFEVIYSKFQEKAFSCPKCRILNKRRVPTHKTLEKLKQAESYKFRNIEVIKDFAENREKILVRCRKHDNTFEVRYTQFRYGKFSCPKCR